MLRRVLVATVVLLLTAAAGRADALTVREVIELSKAGLGDSVLLALIEVDRSIFSIDTATLKELKTAGVSDPVIVAMIHSGRESIASKPAEPVPAPESSPQTEAASAPEPAAPPTPAAYAPVPVYAPVPAPEPVAVVIPVYVPVAVVPLHEGERHSVKRPTPDIPPNCLTAQIPIWGFGGTTHPQQRVCH